MLGPGLRSWRSMTIPACLADLLARHQRLGEAFVLAAPARRDGGQASEHPAQLARVLIDPVRFARIQVSAPRA